MPPTTSSPTTHGIQLSLVSGPGGLVGEGGEGAGITGGHVSLQQPTEFEQRLEFWPLANSAKDDCLISTTGAAERVVVIEGAVTASANVAAEQLRHATSGSATRSLTSDSVVEMQECAHAAEPSAQHPGPESIVPR